MSEVINAGEDQGTTMPEETTLAESLRPLLTTMKLFGIYFECRTNVVDESTSPTTKKSRLRWNAHLIYAVVLAVFCWINALRMFSVFTEIALLI